jgi:hypothetical protein
MKTIKKFPNYKISKNGKVFSKRSKIFLNICLTKRGYSYVGLYRKKQKKNKRVHVLVMEAFGPPRPSEEHRVNHIDCNKQNNHINNLEWMTHAENCKHAYGNGLLTNEKNKIDEFTVQEIKKLLADGVKQTEIASMFGVSQPFVSKVKMKG